MSVPLDALYFQRLQSQWLEYSSEKPRSQALTIIQYKLYSHCFKVDIQRCAYCIPHIVKGTHNIPHSYAQLGQATEILQVLNVCDHLHVYCEWVTLCKHITCTSHAHHCMYDFLVGPNISVIVGVTIGLGIPLLIVITVAVAVAVAFLVRYGKK